MRLLYAADHPDQLACMDELAQMQEEIDFRMMPVVAEPPAGWRGRSGILDAVTVRAWVDFQRPQR